jgi:hypothetical protein
MTTNTTHSVRISRMSIEPGMKISLPEYDVRPYVVTVGSVEHTDDNTRIVAARSGVIINLKPGEPVEVFPKPGEIWA